MSAPTEQSIIFACDGCNKRWKVTVSHYSRTRCECGRPYWALQPSRGGPLVMFPWPGTAAMLRYQQEARPA